MFFLCFWDIIYGSYSDHILFISQYQDCPLDWRTRHFYKIREEKIKVKQIKICQFYYVTFIMLKKNYRNEWQN